MAEPGDKFDALPAPPEALEQGGVEILRAAVLNGGLHVLLRPAFEDPAMWGMVLADIARHAARSFAANYAVSEDEALGQMLEVLQAEFDEPTDLGTTTALS
jgi:hypothetical protein